MILIQEVMTSMPASCGPDDRLDKVAKLMLENDCGVIPVCERGAVIGVITDRDITCRAVAKGKAPVDTLAKDVMTTPVHMVRNTDGVQKAIDLMEKAQVRRLPVIDERGALAGIVAPSDLAPIFASTNVSDFLLAVSYWRRKPTPQPA